ncbi:MAG: sensor histidine kinase [Desulfitobacteriaceae bacterium]
MIQIQQLSLMFMYFVYGLSFYSMGIAIAFQYRSYSNFRLANSLKLLAVFGLIHGLSEWGSVFIPLMAPNLHISSIWIAVVLQRFLQSVSLLFLFLFGIKLIFDTRSKNYWLFTLPITAFASWLIQFAFFIPLLGTNELAHWLLISETWTRHLLALPAGIFTAYGLALQIREARKMNEQTAVRNLWVATASFALFALFSGIGLPQKTNWFDRIINVQTFRQYIGLPIEVFRMVTAVTATASITRMLTIFDVETQRQITESRRWEAVYWERERFARDLHDDVIQSIYGVGLELQTTVPLITLDQGKSANRVKSAVKQLNEVIQGLRAYIQGLEATDDKHSLQALLVDTLDQFREQTGLETELNFQLDWDALKQQVSEADCWQKQIRQIVREALTNVVQHAEASKAQVDIKIEENSLVVVVKDNGQGIPADNRSRSEETRKHMGLQNMRTRAKLLGGNLELFSQKGAGTKLEIRIPLYNRGEESGHDKQN